MHYLLEHLFRETGAQELHAMGQQDLKAEIDRLLEQYMETHLGGSRNKSPRFAYLFARLSESALVIIAHRLRTIAGCDIIYKVDNGKIVETTLAAEEH